ncbi:MAG: sigma-70 family RNA polymerase sigma factor [Phycisphaeraceae bacterium]|nr:sigma-70 family RNA polymerase sigma factor [Phycisphaeraceae bacterium]
MREDPTATGTVTVLLREARSGDTSAREELFRRVYEELRGIARGMVGPGGWPALGLEVTSLVNSACLRLLGRDQLDAEDRRHFFFLFGRAMHDVLVETVKASQTLKQGGDRKRVILMDARAEDGGLRQADLIDLRAALDEFRAVDPNAAKVVELRYFAQRSIRETAELLDRSVASVRRDWTYASAWLNERLSGGEHSVKKDGSE